MNDPSMTPSPRNAVERPVKIRSAPRITVVRTLLAVNILVFMLWTWPGVPQALMAENFLVSWPHLARGRIWVLVTSVLSHILLLHLLVNMVVLVSFGEPMERLMGPKRFTVFFFVAGVVASLTHVATSSLLLGEPGLPALGASGALAGMLMLFSFSFPRARVLFFFILPVPALVAALAFIAIDIWGLTAQMGNGGLPIGHGAHLGGAAVGILYYLLRGRQLRARRSELGMGLGG
jgi:membrane associated rhomboid family serine protease